MKGEEIRLKRKELGFTQKKLASLLGVSTQTVNGYENGKEIPSTKYQLLQQILKIDESNIINNSSDNYLTGYDKRISEINEKIKAREVIISLANKDQSIISHQKEMIALLNKQIELILTAKKNHQSDQY